MTSMGNMLLSSEGSLRSRSATTKQLLYAGVVVSNTGVRSRWTVLCYFQASIAAAVALSKTRSILILHLLL